MNRMLKVVGVIVMAVMVSIEARSMLKGKSMQHATEDWDVVETKKAPKKNTYDINAGLWHNYVVPGAIKTGVAVAEGTVSLVKGTSSVASDTAFAVADVAGDQIESDKW